MRVSCVGVACFLFVLGFGRLLEAQSTEREKIISLGASVGFMDVEDFEPHCGLGSGPIRMIALADPLGRYPDRRSSVSKGAKWAR